jgi:hypothetical protein
MEAVQRLTTRRDETARHARSISLQLLTLALIGTLFWLLALAVLLTPPGRAWIRQVLEYRCTAPLDGPPMRGVGRCHGTDEDVD